MSSGLHFYIHLSTSLRSIPISVSINPTSDNKVASQCPQVGIQGVTNQSFKSRIQYLGIDGIGL